MIKNFAALTEMLRKQPVKKRVAIVAAQDEHTMEAVIRAHNDGLVEPILLGDQTKIIEVLDKLGAKNLEKKIIPIDDPIVCAEKACTGRENLK